MALSPGTSLGAYEIISVLGVGGMGEVYRARDRRLNRDVALKIVPDAFATEPDRLARFKREAQILASLNHPHIGAIYGFEDAGATQALVLELVEGPTLADRISHGPIPIEEALPIARQIAEALEAAHEQGIVHRDLKPANIKLRPDGTVKVLDFGLAKAIDTGREVPASGDLLNSPTITSPAMMTGVGVILGTAAYMSPEQAKGRVADRRSDIWAFGCVGYEMLTGRRAFDGSEIAEVLAGVIKSEPDWQALPADVPPVVRVCLQRCLRKDARQRLRDIGDFRLALDGAFELPARIQDASAVEARRQPRIWERPRYLIATAAILVLVTGLAVWSLTRPRPPLARPSTRFTIALPSTEQINAEGNVAQPMALSRDGRRLFYVATRGKTSELYSRSLDQLNWTAVRAFQDRSLFLSPDGEWAGFLDTGDNTVKKAPLNGGPTASICKLSTAGVFRGATWGETGLIVFATTATPGLMQVASSGGLPTPVTSPSGEIHMHPYFLPGGKALLFTIRRAGEPDRVAAVSINAGKPQVLLEGSSPRFAPTGHLLFLREAALWAVAFDAQGFRFLGDAVPVLEDVTIAGGAAVFDLSNDGSLVYSAASIDAASDRTLVSTDRNGREQPIGAPARAYSWPRLSPDGTRLAVTALDQERDIWIWDFRRPGLTRFTSGRSSERSPIWTPDGRHLVFSSDRDGPRNLFSQLSDGTGPLVRLTDTPNLKDPFSVSPDGKRLVFGEQMQRFDLLTLSLTGEPRPEVLIQTSFGDRDAEISPDGRWLAYASDESGRFEIYVRPFPKVNDGRFQISTNGGGGAVWSRSRSELFYQTRAGDVFSVPFQTAPTFVAGAPSKLFDGSQYVSSGFGRMYDVSPDGQRFLMLKSNDSATQAAVPASLVVVLNWTEELKARVPVK
jgi:serine/threonine protein kinase/WD40 repeat protein